MKRYLKNWFCYSVLALASLTQARADSMTFYGETANNKITVSDLDEGAGRARGHYPNLYVISTNYIFKVAGNPAHGWQPWGDFSPAVGNDGKLEVKIPEGVGDYELVSCTYGTKEEDDYGIPLEMETVTVNVKRIKVEKIKVSSSSSGNGDQEFEGHKEWKFDPSSIDPGKHMVVFFKDVSNPDLTVKSFEVNLEAKVSPASVEPSIFDKTWKKISGDSGNFTSPKYSLTQFINPNKGGVYKIQFDLGLKGFPSEANIVLPLAGAEVKSIVANDLIQTDAFAQKVLAEYDWFQRQLPSNGQKWFVNNGAGDYRGIANHSESQTVKVYNTINSGGLGSVATWFGVPVRTAKISNFVVAYAARKIEVNELFAWISQVIGEPNDSAATKSWDAGWEVAGGANYVTTAQALVKDIFDESDDKNQKLWPNAKFPDNYASNVQSFDPNNKFHSPGFTEMENP